MAPVRDDSAYDCTCINSFIWLQNLTQFQVLRLVLHGVSAMYGEGSGKRSSKGALWGVKKTTPGMIAMAATVVSTLAHVYSA